MLYLEEYRRIMKELGITVYKSEDKTLFLVFQTVEENSYSVLSPYQAPAREEGDLYAQIRSYNITTIPREEIK